MDFLRGEQLLVVDHRSDVVDAGDVPGRQHRVHPGQCSRTRHIDAADPRVRAVRIEAEIVAGEEILEAALDAALASTATTTTTTPTTTPTPTPTPKRDRAGHP